LLQILFSTPEKAFQLLVYTEAVANASLIAKPSELSPECFYGDSRISKYFDISVAKDKDVLDSNSIVGLERSTDSSLSSSTTYSVSSRPSSREFASHYGDSFGSSQCC
jgi:hypothetical protein